MHQNRSRRNCIENQDSSTDCKSVANSLSQIYADMRWILLDLSQLSSNVAIFAKRNHPVAGHNMSQPTFSLPPCNDLTLRHNLVGPPCRNKIERANGARMHSSMNEKPWPNKDIQATNCQVKQNVSLLYS